MVHSYVSKSTAGGVCRGVGVPMRVGWARTWRFRLDSRLRGNDVVWCGSDVVWVWRGVVRE